MGNSLVSSAPRRALEDVWRGRLGGELFASEEQLRCVLEDMIRSESGSSCPEVQALVLVLQFFEGGASIAEVFEREEEIRMFLLGNNNNTAEIPKRGEDSDEEEEDGLDFRGANGVLFVSSDVFIEEVRPAKVERDRLSVSREFLGVASCLAAHILSAEAVILPEIQEALLPVLIQEPRAVKLSGPLLRLASFLAASGMRVSPTWRPHLLGSKDLEPTVALFDQCPAFGACAGITSPLDGQVKQLTGHLSCCFLNKTGFGGRGSGEAVCVGPRANFDQNQVGRRLCATAGAEA